MNARRAGKDCLERNSNFMSTDQTPIVEVNQKTMVPEIKERFGNIGNPEEVFLTMTLSEGDLKKTANVPACVQLTHWQQRSQKSGTRCGQQRGGEYTLISPGINKEVSPGITFVDGDCRRV